MFTLEVGNVTLETIGKGSKYEHPGTVLTTAEGAKYDLVPGDSQDPFDQEELKKFVGRKCRCAGSIEGSRLELDSIETADDSESQPRQFKRYRFSAA